MAINYNRQDLARDLAMELQITPTKAKKIVEKTIGALVDALLDDRRIILREFGTLEVVKRKPKIGRNPHRPADGQYLIPARRVVRFRAGKDLFDQLNVDNSTNENKTNL